MRTFPPLLGVYDLAKRIGARGRLYKELNDCGDPLVIQSAYSLDCFAALAMTARNDELCTFHSTLCTLHFPLCTLHSALSTLHSELYTFHSAL